MGEMKELVENVKKKKFGKQEWLIVILVGIFFMIVFFPQSGKERKSEEIKDVPVNTFSGNGTIEGNDYKEYMEKQLEGVLRSIDGIDVANVMITFTSSGEEVVLTEKENTIENTTEEDNQGGNREIQSDSLKEKVYTQKQGDEERPFVTSTIAPKVEGVLIVVGGNRADSLRTQIVRAVQALFDVDSHKVVVIKMKE